MVNKPLHQIVQDKAYRIVGWQLVGIVIIAFAALVISRNLRCAGAVLAGGMVYGLPNLVFVWRVFRYAGANQMTRFVAAFIAGEVLKLVLSGIAFLLIVKYLPVSLICVLVGLGGSMVAFWTVCIVQFSKP